jgi:UDP-N-acetylglucosamine/UDP-N-acetylgalactosamine 4-epimerase
MFNVACGERITLNELLEELRRLTGSEIEALYEESRPGDVPHSLADISRARERLGYVPAVDARTGLAKTLKYTEGLARRVATE